MIKFKKLPKTIYYSSILFTILGFIFSIIYSLISYIYICPTSTTCPANPTPIIFLVIIVTFLFFIFGLIFGVVIQKLYNFFRVE
ncbi:MAG: hypothetical protein CL773_05615 [Chloroflexi bacterium]|nr:hypothetical protein [Chloroflexota bacterium]